MIFRTFQTIIENASKSDFIRIVTSNSIDTIKNIDLKMTFNPTDNTVIVEDYFKTPSTFYLFVLDEIQEIRIKPSQSKRIPSRLQSVKSQSIDPVATIGDEI